MKVIKIISYGIQTVLGVLILANLACGDPTPVSKVLSQGVHNAILCMFLLFGVAAMTQIYDNIKIKKGKTINK